VRRRHAVAPRRIDPPRPRAASSAASRPRGSAASAPAIPAPSPATAMPSDAGHAPRVDRGWKHSCSSSRLPAADRDGKVELGRHLVQQQRLDRQALLGSRALAIGDLAHVLLADRPASAVTPVMTGTRCRTSRSSASPLRQYDETESRADAASAPSSCRARRVEESVDGRPRPQILRRRGARAAARAGQYDFPGHHARPILSRIAPLRLMTPGKVQPGIGTAARARRLRG